MYTKAYVKNGNVKRLFPSLPKKFGKHRNLDKYEDEADLKALGFYDVVIDSDSGPSEPNVYAMHTASFDEANEVVRVDVIRILNIEERNDTMKRARKEAYQEMDQENIHVLWHALKELVDGGLVTENRVTKHLERRDKVRNKFPYVSEEGS